MSGILRGYLPAAREPAAAKQAGLLMLRISAEARHAIRTRFKHRAPTGIPVAEAPDPTVDSGRDLRLAVNTCDGAEVARMVHLDDPTGPSLAGEHSCYRVIVAIDVEQSTTRPDVVKAELRRTLYELFDQALRSAGIHRRRRDGFIDRGDGILALIHPVDQAPKALLLSRVVPALSQLLASHNANLPPAERLQRQLRVRVVVHAGEVQYDANGCFGEALDIAFRLLDADHVKKALRDAAGPLTLIVSADIYRSVVCQGYHGIDQHAYQPFVRVHVAGRRQQGWIQSPQ